MPKPNPVESAAKKLAWEMGSWRSIDLRLRTDCENTDPAKPTEWPRTFRIAEHYIETAAGQRFYGQRMIVSEKETTFVTLCYTDGSQFTQVNREDKGGAEGREQLTIKRFFQSENNGKTYRPAPLSFLYVGLKPLHEVLNRADYLGTGRHLDRECDGFLFRHFEGAQDSRELVYWLDRETGITLRFEYYGTAALRSEGRPDHVWNAESIDEVGGHHLVLKSVLLQYNGKVPELKNLQMRYKAVTDEVKFDQAYPMTTFRPVVKPTATVIDMVKNTFVSPKTKSQPPTTSTAAPIRAADDPGWGMTVSTAGLLLGASALGAGVLLWWRRG